VRIELSIAANDYIVGGPTFKFHIYFLPPE
jgi:hypothetical protein